MREKFKSYVVLHDLLQAETGLPDDRLLAYARLYDRLDESDARLLAMLASVKKPTPKVLTKLDGRTREARARKRRARTDDKAKLRAKAVQEVRTKARRDVARGKRPRAWVAMARVMGTKTMGAAPLVAALKKRGWLPASENPQQYISYLLSSNKDVFEKVRRGLYRVRKQAAPKVEAKKTDDLLMLGSLRSGWRSTSQLATAAGFGTDKTRKILDLLVKSGKAKVRHHQKQLQWALSNTMVNGIIGSEKRVSHLN